MISAGPTAPPIPLTDPRLVHRRLRPADLEAFERVAGRGDFTLGADLSAFEEEFARYCGVAGCVGVGDGTAALRLALLALGAGAGTEVVTTPLTFVATAEAIALTGARVRFVDVDPVSRTMNPAALRSVLGASTAAVVPVHLYGRPAAIAEIVDLCASAGVPVIEDAAQAHGATVGGRRVGSLGAAGAFSFYPTKNLGAMGDGGAVVSDDPELLGVVRSLRHHGAAPEDANRHVRIGLTSRLDNLQAALLRPRLRLLDELNDSRRRAADRYRDALSGLPLRLPPSDPVDARQVYHLFVVEVDDRDRVLANLRARGIRAGIHYPTPVHLQPAWSNGFGAPGDFPVAEAISRRALSLPMFPGISEEQILRVAQALRALL